MIKEMAFLVHIETFNSFRFRWCSGGPNIPEKGKGRGRGERGKGKGRGKGGRGKGKGKREKGGGRH